jgi:hypothetical protein
MSILMFESIFHSYLTKEEADRMCEKVDAFAELREFFGPKFNSLHVARQIGISRAAAKRLVEAELDDFEPSEMNVWLAWLRAENWHASTRKLA